MKRILAIALLAFAGAAHAAEPSPPTGYTEVARADDGTNVVFANLATHRRMPMRNDPATKIDVVDLWVWANDGTSLFSTMAFQCGTEGLIFDVGADAHGLVLGTAHVRARGTEGWHVWQHVCRPASPTPQSFAPSKNQF